MRAFIFLGALLMVSVAVNAQEEAIPYYGYQPAGESLAFKNFNDRPKNDRSRIVYLIDRFANADVEVIYGGYRMHAKFASNICRWFLGINYKEQTPKEWTYQWCNRTVPGGELIWVVFADGSRKPARDVLVWEIEKLEELEKQSEN